MTGKLHSRRTKVEVRLSGATDHSPRATKKRPSAEDQHLLQSQSPKTKAQSPKTSHQRPKAKDQRPTLVGVDTGGTFTDFVYEVNNRFRVFKLPSTPVDPSLAIISGLRKIAAHAGVRLEQLEVVHGTTVGTNALLQRKGARTALVTTLGFEDVLAIGRQARPELYNLNVVRPPPLVEPNLRIGVNERVTATGEVLQPLADTDMSEVVKRIKKGRVEAIAISLLFSFVRPEHELRLVEVLSTLNVPISVSHQLIPEYREYERTSTVTVNAYLQPLMGAYIKRLAEKSPRLKVMQSSGGSISASAAALEPVRTILSGPAGGVVGALRSARTAGFKNIITFDMGGTSTDVGLCDNQGMRMTNEASVAGMPVAIPIMDIHTVGAGGGSIASVDEGGALRVGPESAGADPGPSCYGRSLLPTVTDAHLVLGHFGGTGLLGGEFELNEKRAWDVMAKLADEMTAASGRLIDAFAAAKGVLAVVNTNMERALRRISVERGHDPREFTLLPFGGAGSLHAVELARALQIPTVFAPQDGGALSAIGVLTSDVVKDQSRTVMLEVKPGIERMLEKLFIKMEREGQSILRKEGFAIPRQRHERSLGMRYKGQSFELEIKHTTDDISRSFHQAHQFRYGYSQESNTVEIVSVRLRSSGFVKQLKQRQPRVLKKGVFVTPSGYVWSYFEGRRTRTGLYRRDDLAAGVKLRPPCIITEYSATTLIPEGVRASVDLHGNLLIEV